MATFNPRTERLERHEVEASESMTNNLTRASLLLAAVLVLALAPSAKADALVTVTGAESNSLYKMYVCPYTASANGVSTPVICGDFEREAWFGDSRFSGATRLASVTFASDMKWASQVSRHNQANWLATRLLGTRANTEAAAIQFALWESLGPMNVSAHIANGPDGITFVSGASNANGVHYWRNGEASSNLGPLARRNFMIYTRPKCIRGHCDAGPGPHRSVVQTPEPGTAFLLLIGLSALVWMARRARRLNPL